MFRHIDRILARWEHRILVVDDDARILKLLEVGLRQHGLNVLIASSGLEAIDIYRCHFPSIDAVLLDVQMPGQNGPETLAALHTLNPQISCFFMSGDLGHYTAKNLIDMGATGVFMKPFCLTQVATTIRDLTRWGGRKTIFEASESSLPSSRPLRAARNGQHNAHLGSILMPALSGAVRPNIVCAPD